MGSGRSGNKARGCKRTSSPSDAFLVASAANGDSAALSKLMDRYDRLVRYTIFSIAKGWCTRDPQWLESVACDTWMGFVRSIRRQAGTGPDSVQAYLVGVARNLAVTALRGAASASCGGTEEPNVPSIGRGDAATHLPAATENPLEVAAKLELLEALHACLAELDPHGQAMVSQLPAITERRWREAAEALNLKESTLRSRWQQALVRLKSCIKRKTGIDFAPQSLWCD
ncbi:MAG: RNA polymerase sigma factor [Phycisphaerae bacterium]